METAELDLERFRWIESQTSQNDRRALLSIQQALCTALGCYRYLEVGSHLGGSLQPHVVDVRCQAIFSIDSRPGEQPDERWRANYKYDGNTTERMLAGLAAIPDADIGKIRTFATPSWALSSTSIPVKIDFAFIDGEHTNRAVLRDFWAVRRFLSESSILAFHDCFVIAGAILQTRRLLRHEHLPHQFLYFPGSNIVSIVFGPKRLIEVLRQFGWQLHLPISYSHVVRIKLQKLFPSLFRKLNWHDPFFLDSKAR